MQRWLDMMAARRSPRQILLDAGLHGVAGLLGLLPDMERRMASVRLVEDLEYARHGHRALRLVILWPDGPGPHPVLVYLQGGGFAGGSKRTHRAVAAAYTSHGYLVHRVDYRLAPQHRFPAAI